MTYIIDKSLWHDGNETVIKTDIGETVLRLEKTKRRMRSHIQVYDRYHVPIGMIEKKLGGLHFKLHYDNRIIATIKRHRSLFRKKLLITTSEGTQFSIKGDLLQFEYAIKKSKRNVAQISSKLADRSDQYGVATDDVKHRYIFICTVVALSTM